MKHVLLSLVFLCAPVLGAAQDIDVAPWQDRFDQCLAANADWSVCKGEAANQCMEETEGGFSTYGMVACIAVERDLWDAKLNEIWPDVMDYAKRADAEEAEFFDDQYSKRAEALLAAQRAWIAFRDAECELAYAEWGSGSFRRVAWISCQSDMTANRVIRLREIPDMR